MDRPALPGGRRAAVARFGREAADAEPGTGLINSRPSVREPFISWLRLTDSPLTMIFRLLLAITPEDPLMKRLWFGALLGASVLLVQSAPAQDKKKVEELKKGLQ